jgi:glucose/arabinose dehydrogenase/plastocyanin
MKKKQMQQYRERVVCKYSLFLNHKSYACIRVISVSITLLILLCTALLLSGCPTATPTALTLGLSLIAEGFNHPIGMAVPNDLTGRIFIVDQVGKIFIIDSNGKLLDTPFLDLTDSMVDLQSSYDERGLLSMAFHPDFASNGRFFVFYNVPLKEEDPAEFDSRSRISELLVSTDNSSLADPESEVVLLEIVQPQFNHNGGQLAFGPDGYLYISIGDGGSANDVGEGHTPDLGNGQDTSNLLGTILRYDASLPGELSVPEDNPFIGDQNVLDQIYAFGLRNPWRFSFEMSGEQRLFCADAGQNLYEEVNIIEAGGNYGWNIKEGTKCFDTENPNDPPALCSDTGAQGETLIDPILEYSHLGNADESIGTSAIGGFVYHGNDLPVLEGRYIFGDFSRDFVAPNGSVFLAMEDESEWQFTEATINFIEAGVDTQLNGRLKRFLLSFGQDAKGEIYLFTTTNVGPTGTTGQVFEIVSADLTISSTTTSAMQVTTTTSTATTTTTLATPETIDIVVEDFRFDADDNNTTQVDTVTINAGDTIRWNWRVGIHTVTSGEGFLAQGAGDLFDVPSNSLNQTFSFTFNEAGVFPYFCRPHEFFNMKGIINVQ